MKREHPSTPFFLSCPSSFDTAGGRCDLFHMPGGSGENKHPGTFKTPPQTNKTGPRIEQQGTGRVFIPPTRSRPLQEQ
ncbi:hypothetical protein MRAK_45 [Propionibacterium phage MrAK]|uniref:Uncharacterized protein n=1 Tax=Propionibacterium phage MrAK TaxID=1655016 RepID=A0A0H4J0Q1_9CAUD|nr:hypothetical protein AFL86_gp45 [Propionibacterium phage MrAK]AKO60229.1 hypothetical protein MRAK_45 [Propionibacterium phage MrAK]